MRLPDPGSKVRLTYESGRVVVAEMFYESTATAGKQSYSVEEDGTFRKLTTTAGGEVRAISEVLGRWKREA